MHHSASGMGGACHSYEHDTGNVAPMAPVSRAASAIRNRSCAHLRARCARRGEIARRGEMLARRNGMVLARRVAHPAPEPWARHAGGRAEEYKHARGQYRPLVRVELAVRRARSLTHGGVGTIHTTVGERHHHTAPLSAPRRGSSGKRRSGSESFSLPPVEKTALK